MSEFENMLELLQSQENARRLAASDDGDAEVWELRGMDPLTDTLFIIDYRRRAVSHVRRGDDPTGYGVVTAEIAAEKAHEEKESDDRTVSTVPA